MAHPGRATKTVAPAGAPTSRTASRNSRFARLRATAEPTFFEATTATRAGDPPLGTTRPEATSPPLWGPADGARGVSSQCTATTPAARRAPRRSACTIVASSRRRSVTISRALLTSSSSPTGTSLGAGTSGGQLCPAPATARGHNTAPCTGAHPNAESMLAGPAAVVWLKGSLHDKLTSTSEGKGSSHESPSPVRRQGADLMTGIPARRTVRSPHG